MRIGLIDLDEPVNTKENGEMTMKISEIIKQLKDLQAHCKSMITKDSFPIWEKDCRALEYAVETLTFFENIKWRDAVTNPPELGERVILTDGHFTGEGYRGVRGYHRYNGLTTWAGTFHRPVKKWMPMPKP